MPVLCSENIQLKKVRFNAMLKLVMKARKIRLITATLFLGAVFIPAAWASLAQAQSQEYMGEIPFKNSEEVSIQFDVSEEVQEVKKIRFNMKKLWLEPENKKSGVANVTLTDAGLTDESVYKIADGKLTADSFFVFDLTVIDSCIYGTIGINYKTDNGVMTAEPVYVVIPNITTPKDIPENILEP